LLYRFYPFLKTQPLFFLSLIIISSFTILIAGIAAINELDLKKIIALSTLSQLGVIISALALGLPNLALFHLMTHALFKALLFVCAGSLIHINSHNQDLRTAGIILPQIPSISSTFLISNIALCGLPFLAAFYSKDIILEIRVYSPLN
jgi:NADH-ubiquinone oxidoreductase chain 5